MKTIFFLLSLLPSLCFGNDVADALQKIRPGAEWTLSGEAYEGLTWVDPRTTKPTKSEVAAAIILARRERLRKQKYPSLEEQVNALIEGGAKLDDLKQKINEINLKYP